MDKFESHKSDSRPRRQPISLFGPIIVIALGLYFLARNMGFAPELHWGAALRFWPLFLVFAGLNIVARQLPRPLGTLGSAAISLLAVIVFGTVLFMADQIPALQRYSGTEPTFQTETISFPASEVRTADIAIDFAIPSATLFALSDSVDLIAGEVSYQGELIFDHEVSQGKAVVNLGTNMDGDNWVEWLNPANWADNAPEWRLGLNPRIPTNLSLSFASGSVEADLRRLNLTGLTVDGSSGSAELMLPDGDYTMDYDLSSGSVALTLPERGRATLNIDGSSGSVTLLLPESMAMRVRVDGSSGSFDASSRLEHIGDDDGTEIWQTSGYATAEDRVDVELDMSSGSIEIRNSR